MRHLVTAVVVVAGVLAEGMATLKADDYSSSSDGGFPCGEVSVGNSSAQFGQYNWIQYIVKTTGSLDVCGQWIVTAGASVSDVPGSAATSSGVMYAEVKRQVPVPSYDRNYTTTGVHTSTTVIPFYILTFASQSNASVGSEPVENCSVYNGGGSYYTWDPVSHTCVEITTWSPIIVDVARDGYHLTDASQGVSFDLNGDGVPEQVAWTRADSDDAFLALDRNGNGVIDNGSELFGNRTPTFAPHITALNGFEALRFLEVGVPDHSIAANEAKLLLWTDRNHNGISEPDELVSTGAAGLAAIGTEYQEKRRVDRFKNEFRQQGTIVWADGVVAPVYDVWLRAE